MKTKRLLSLAIGLGLAATLAGCDQPSSDQAAVQDKAQAAVQAEEQTQSVYVDTEHNARNSLDWNGTYAGTIPCADCAGIETVLVLGMDGTFELTETYLGYEEDGQFRHQGAFTWNDAGNTITLTNDSGDDIQFFVGENQLFRLDREGKRITGNLADMYVLQKQHAQ
ncbi:copper resistance protein NlpE [Photobacterium sp. 1_MG-2023]|uniref:copper resistance protein NlpE n=1 Tax=Photobacterium sp. 1_MG-2023 TaxID=3062646 RepID=UPI0026E45F44|nr:copper resistance protein NlpE [Photobacterium sp. 1_MG-2023]MDO6708771.1 copper resistance protein NlpE [Photobacterium sp. 1_MG-2023]